MALLKENKAQISFSYLLVILGLLGMAVVALMVLTGVLDIQSEAVEEKSEEATSIIGDSKPGSGLQFKTACEDLCDTTYKCNYDTVALCTSECVSTGTYNATTGSISNFDC